MDRRDFIKSAASITAATIVAPTSVASSEYSRNEKLIISAPMLQNFAETSVGIAFSVSDMANGYVKISENPDLSDYRLVKCGGFRVTDINSDVIHIRVTGLKPSTRYYYSVGADKISYKGGYNMKIVGNENDPRIYSFITAGNNTKSHFCVINDTHVNWDTFDKLQQKIFQLKPSCVIWNGDASNCEETIESQKEIFLSPKIQIKDYASEIPYLFTPGNHDVRGMANRHLEKVWMYRQPEERLSRDWDLGRNYAVRIGDIAMIGLDTGEDKLDENPIFAGLFVNETYREAQTKWLGDVLSLKNIRSAKYIVAFCHIPLYDSNPKSNPGDIHPDDTDERYTCNYAQWQRTCSQLWLPLLEKAGCKLIIAAHEHAVRVDTLPSWTQVVGGGPNQNDPATVIEGKIVDNKLIVKIHDVYTNTIINEFSL